MAIRLRSKDVSNSEQENENCGIIEDKEDGVKPEKKDYIAMWLSAMLVIWLPITLGFIALLVLVLLIFK